jgi:hypothetical protein
MASVCVALSPLSHRVDGGGYWSPGCARKRLGVELDAEVEASLHSRGAQEEPRPKRLRSTEGEGAQAGGASDGDKLMMTSNACEAFATRRPAGSEFVLISSEGVGVFAPQHVIGMMCVTPELFSSIGAMQTSVKADVLEYIVQCLAGRGQLEARDNVHDNVSLISGSEVRRHGLAPCPVCTTPVQHAVVCLLLQHHPVKHAVVCLPLRLAPSTPPLGNMLSSVCP